MCKFLPVFYHFLAKKVNGKKLKLEIGGLTVRLPSLRRLSFAVFRALRQMANGATAPFVIMKKVQIWAIMQKSLKRKKA